MCVLWFVDVEIVYFVDFYVGDYLGGWNGDEGDVFIGINVVGVEVVVYLYCVCVGRECYGEGEWFVDFFSLIDEGFDGFWVGVDFVFLVGFEVDGLVVVVYELWNDYWFFG